MTHNAYIRIAPGTRVTHEGRTYVLDKAIDHRTVLARDDETGKWTHLPVAELGVPADGAPQTPAPAIEEHGPAYAAASRRLKAVQAILDLGTRTEAGIARIAGEHGMSRSALYGWLRKYEDAPQLSSLIAARPGPDKGGKQIDPRLEAIIDAAIAATQRTKRRLRVAATIVEVEKQCKAAGLPPPHANTVRARVDALPRARTLRERGRGDEAKAYIPLIGTLSADRPMQMVQMDHTRGDVELVDDELRLPIGRPWITLLIDVCTRKIVGVSVSMDAPSGFTAGHAVANAILPKDDYLRRLDVQGEWDAWGRITMLHMDNAREFRGAVLTTSCEAHGINPIYRPVKKPEYGAHIERLMGELAKELKTLPGATGSNITERKGSDPEKDAAYTLSEFEARLVDWIVNVYNQHEHSALDGMTPAAFWKMKATPDGDEPSGLVQEPHKDPERLRIDFMPFEKGVIGRRGIRWNWIDYWHDGFRTRVHEPDPDNRKIKRKFLFRYDPRDITRIWFLDPGTDRYQLVGTWSKNRPATSLWEWRAVKAYRREQGKKTYNEEAMFETLDRLRRRDEAAVGRTKTARRQRQRAANAARHAAAVDERQQAALPTAVPQETSSPAARRPFKPFRGIEFDN